jgi:hypothetical protein
VGSNETDAESAFSHSQTAAKVWGFPPIASGFTAETDWLLEGDGFELSVLTAYRNTPGFQPFFDEGTKGVLSQKEGTKKPGWCGVLRGKASTIRGRRSIRTAPTPYLRNTLLADGSPAVKEDVERYLLGHAGTDVHAGCGEQWIKTLKAAIEIIRNPVQAPPCAPEGGAVQLVNA